MPFGPNFTDSQMSAYPCLMVIPLDLLCRGLLLYALALQCQISSYPAKFTSAHLPRLVFFFSQVEGKVYEEQNQR